MPEIRENLAKWKSFNWRQGGDEWSEWWGGPKSQWRATLYPRLKEFLPAHRLLEIAPGYGRWTQFLRHHCDELIGIDLTPECVEACRRRFRRDSRLTFHVNDGKSLAAVQDGSVDFVFSFDSLVHVEEDVMDAYLAEVARVLSEDGVAFLHHSNMAAYSTEEVGSRTPHVRGRSVSAETVAHSATGVGLICFRQELVRWGADHRFLNDSFTWIARIDSTHDRPREVIANPTFMEEADEALARATRWRRYRVRARRAATSRLRRVAKRGVRSLPVRRR